MSQTVDTRSAAATRAEEWLSTFESALAARDIDAAAGLFGAESFWRDLVAFTWNITTVEGPDGCRGPAAQHARPDRPERVSAPPPSRPSPAA